MILPFKKFKGIVAPLAKSNVDTDAIIPKQYLKSIKKTGFGDNLFDEWRYLDKGEPGMDCSTRVINRDFILNRSPYNKATILLTNDNFGCGSSREHAAWAFADFGFKTIIAESFADIFYNNCSKNGILAIELSKPLIKKLFDLERLSNPFELNVDLKNQTLQSTLGFKCDFDIDSYRKKGLLGGLDEIGQTLKFTKEINKFEQERKENNPWLFMD